MQIRAATPDDIPRLVEIVNACWRHAYRGVLPDDVLDRDMTAMRIERQRRRMAEGWPSFAAIVDDRIVGMTRLGLIARECDAEIEGLYVDPVAARAGVGRALVGHACRYFAAQDKRSLYIETLRDNRIGRAFYGKLGGRLVEGKRWTFDGVEYPAVGYIWDDLRKIAEPDGGDGVPPSCDSSRSA